MPASIELTLAKIGGVLLVVLALAVGCFYWGHHNEALAFQDYKDQQALTAQHQVTNNHDAAAALAASDVAVQKKIADDAKGKMNELAQANVVLNASAADYAARLRYALAHPSIVRVAVPGIAASGSVDNGPVSGGFPDVMDELVKFNSAQFYRADQYAVRLTAAQAIIKQDRLVCNGALPGIPASAAQ